jgi:hypothetical protein
MAYRKIKKYRTRKDIIKLFYKKFKVVIWFVFVALLIWSWMRRVYIYDYVRTYFY